MQITGGIEKGEPGHGERLAQAVDGVQGGISEEVGKAVPKGRHRPPGPHPTPTPPSLYWGAYGAAMASPTDICLAYRECR